MFILSLLLLIRLISCFCSVFLQNLLSEKLEVQGSLHDLSYEEAIKIVAKFIGEDKYMALKQKLEHFGIDPAKKFQSVKDREYFNKYALAQRKFIK
jgi:hypothetical protein